MVLRAAEEDIHRKILREAVPDGRRRQEDGCTVEELHPPTLQAGGSLESEPEHHYSSLVAMGRAEPEADYPGADKVMYLVVVRMVVRGRLVDTYRCLHNIKSIQKHY